MKKRYIVIPAVIAVILFLTWSISVDTEPIPESPDMATKLGHYTLDDHRAVEIRKQDGAIQYCEEVTSEDGDGFGVVSYVINVIDSIKLSEGWSITLLGPDTILIQTGRGETIKREFGQIDIESDTEVLRTVTRKPINRPNKTPIRTSE